VLVEKIKIELQEAIVNLKNVSSRIDVVEKECELSEKVEEGERVRFQNGDSNLLMVYLREESTADANTRKVEYQAELIKNYISYLKVLGQPLTTVRSKS